jgi:ferredoxin-NADP reductase
VAWEGERPFRVEAKSPEADGIFAFTLASADGAALPPFEPGQFLTLALDVPDQERPVIRCYSLCAAPDGRTYRIGVKRVGAPPLTDHPPGVASSFLADQVQVGDTLRVRAPAGRFTLTPGDPGPAILLAGGIGITPILGMLEGLVARGEARPVHLYLGVRDGRQHPFRARLTELAAAHPWLTAHVAYSRPRREDQQGRDFDHRGRVTVDLLRRTLPPLDANPGFYVCGPGPFMADLTEGLDGLGVPASRVHVEAFGKAAIRPFTRRLTKRLPTPAAGDDVVTFATSGVSVSWDPGAGNLLELAMANGVFLPFACMAGHCGTCATTLTAGEVVYPVEPQFPLRDGRCLLCIGVPQGPVTLDA